MKTPQTENFNFDLNALEQTSLAQIHKDLKQGAKFAVALSGGSDSVFLLYIAHLICSSANLVALHYNHKVRKNADIDEKFCKALCKSLGVKIVVKTRTQNLKKISEESLRNLRYKFFESECKKLKIDTILQGHIKTDIAETMLMRLMRGAGLEGLCAPRAIAFSNSLTKIRPLLTLTKVEIQTALKKFGIAWREDESNFTNIFLRNKIRNEILPLIENLSDIDFSSSTLRTHNLLEEDAKFVEEIFLKETKFTNGKIKLSKLASNSTALLRRAVQKILAKNNQRLRASAVDLFLENCKKGSAKTSLKSGFLFFNAKERTLEILQKENFKSWAMPLSLGENILPDGSMLILEEVKITKSLFEKIKSGEFDEAKFAFIAPEFCEICARNLSSKDAYAPIASAKVRLVKDMMSAKKVPILKRKGFPLVYLRSGEAIWSPSLAIADFCKLNKIGFAFRLTYRNSY